MKKLILSSLAMASLAFAANAVTNMCVEQSDGTIFRHNVDNVKQVYYESTTDQGVTVSGKEGIYTYVDLGLESGTKWATCNVGATKPTEYGDYFAWGETKPKTDYSWATYKWCDNKKTDIAGNPKDFTKYVEDSTIGLVDNIIVLTAEDDAAAANWSSAWRMPTYDEFVELVKGCNWEWTNDFNDTGVAGKVGTSKANGNKIFLPAAGDYWDSHFCNVGERGYYWTSSLGNYSTRFAYNLFFSSDGIDRYEIGRYRGRSVRAVLK